MNKNYLIILLISISTTVLAQNHRFVYEYSFKIDSLNRENITKELMNLDLSKEGSSFYSSEKQLYDSLMNAEMKKNVAVGSTHIDFSKVKNNSKVGSSVTKNQASSETVLHTSINGDQYGIVLTEKLEWKIGPETQEIHGYKAQKATTESSGMKWTAWFTNEIQIQDGPYKFNGLPGLILKISDEKNDHVFEFVGSKKLNYAPSMPETRGQKELIISAQNFNQLWKDYLRDPAKKLRQMYSDTEGTLIKVTDSNGRELSQSEIIRNKEKRVRDQLKNTNNFLELTLYR